MVENMSLKDFVELPEIMLKKSNDVKYIQLLSERTISYYYYTNLKKDLLNLFRKFQDSKYLISFDDEYSLKSKQVGHEINRSINRNNDKVLNYVEKRIDLNIWSRDIYNILVNLSEQLTFQETVYLTSTFFDSKTEEEISDKLEICRKSLYKIKKSCLVKLKLEFDKYGLLN